MKHLHAKKLIVFVSLAFAACSSFAFIRYLSNAATAGFWAIKNGGTARNVVAEMSAAAIGVGGAAVISSQLNDELSIDFFGIGEKIGEEIAGATGIAVTNKARTNPDPRRYDDPSGSSLDVTPKSQYIPADTLPGNGSLATIARIGLGSYSYIGSDGNFRDYDVIPTFIGPTTSQAQADSIAKSQTAAAHAGWNFSGGYYISATDWRAVWYRTRTLACAPGYTPVSGQCILTNAPAVTKPSGKVGCEVIYEGGAFKLDAANPTCTEVASKLQVSGKKATYAQDASNWIEVTREADGSGTIRIG